MMLQDPRKRSPNKLLNKQLSSITNTLTQAAQRRESDMMKRLGARGTTGTLAGGTLRGGEGRVSRPDAATQNTRDGVPGLHLQVSRASRLNPLGALSEIPGLSKGTDGQTMNLHATIDSHPTDLDALFTKLTSGQSNIGQGASSNDTKARDNKPTSIARSKSPFSGLPAHIDDIIKGPSSPSTTTGNDPDLREMLADLERMRRSPTFSSCDLGSQQKTVNLDRTCQSAPASALDEAKVLQELRTRLTTMALAEPPAPLAPNADRLFQTRDQDGKEISYQDGKEISYQDGKEISYQDGKEIPYHAMGSLPSTPSDSNLGSDRIAIVDIGPSYQEGERECGQLDTTHGPIEKELLPGARGYKAQQEQQAYIQGEEAKLIKIIDEVSAEEASAEEAKRHAAADKRHLLNRIIVTNVAAGAEVEDLQRVFYYYAFCISDITILEEKHPHNGTRAAYIDFHDRMSAWKASRVMNNIFGLNLRVRLAVDVDIPEKNMLLLHAASQEKKRKEAASETDRAARDDGFF